MFCFNIAKSLTRDFVEVIREKPCISLRVKRLSCSQNTCVYLRQVVPSSTDTHGPSKHVLTAAAGEEAQALAADPPTSLLLPRST